MDNPPTLDTVRQKKFKAVSRGVWVQEKERWTALGHGGKKKQKPTKLYSWNSDRTAIVIVQFFIRWDNLALACIHKHPLVASGALGDQMQGDVPCTLLTHGLSAHYFV